MTQERRRHGRSPTDPRDVRGDDGRSPHGVDHDSGRAVPRAAARGGDADRARNLLRATPVHDRAAEVDSAGVGEADALRVQGLADDGYGNFRPVDFTITDPAVIAALNAVALDGLTIEKG